MSEYQDMDGNPTTLYKLVRIEPDWAVSRIDFMNNKIAELEKVLALVKKDLLMRAEEDSNGCKVVDLSSSIWIKLTEALKEDK